MRVLFSGLNLFFLFGAFAAGNFLAGDFSFLPEAYANSKGEYPGSGDYSKWIQAADSNEDGVDYVRRGNLTMAIQCYDEAISLFPGDASFYFNKASALKKQGKVKESIPLFKKAVELEKDFDSAWYNLGNAHQELAEYAEAQICFEKTVKIDPAHMHAWFNLGEILLAQKKLEAAKKAFDKAAVLPGSAEDKKDIAEYRRKVTLLMQKAGLSMPASEPESEGADQDLPGKADSAGEKDGTATESNEPEKNWKDKNTPAEPGDEIPRYKEPGDEIPRYREPEDPNSGKSRVRR